MTRKLRIGAFVLYGLGALVGSAAAQDFVPSTTRTVPTGDFRLTGYPVGLFGRNGSPDRLGGGWRLGYGLSDNLDVQGNAAFFDRFSLLGVDSSFRIERGVFDMAVVLGGHRALIRAANDSTALDGALLVGAHVAPRLRLVAGMSASREWIDHTRDSAFNRVYLVPGLDLRLTDRVAFVSEAGLGLNSDSPGYLTAGFSFFLPVADRARAREWY